MLKPEKKFVAEQAELDPLIIGSSLLTNTYNIKIFMWQFKEEEQLVDGQRLVAYCSITLHGILYQEKWSIVKGLKFFVALEKRGSHTPTLQVRSLKQKHENLHICH